MAAKAITDFKTIDLTHMTLFGSFLNKVPLGIPVGPNVQTVLIGEMVQPVAGGAAAPAQIDEGTLNDSRTYTCVWRKLR